MKIQIKPTQDPGLLEENLSRQFEETAIVDGKIEVDIPDEKKEKKLGLIERTPGVEKIFLNENEIREGLEGRPVQEKAYARLEDDESVAEALLATIDGYDLVVLEGGLDWQLKLLRRFNPDIKQLSSGRSDIFDVDKSLFEEGEEEMIDYDLSEEQVELLLSYMQPGPEEKNEE